MHDMTSSGARGALTRYEVIPVKGGNIRESIPGDSRHRSEQLSCTKYFHPSYGLFSMIFQSFNSFSRITEIV